MATGIIYVKGFPVNRVTKAIEALCDFTTDWSPVGGSPLEQNDIIVPVSLSNSTVQINNSIKSAVLGIINASFPTGLQVSNLIISGGAQ